MNRLEHAQVQSNISLTTKLGKMQSLLSSQVRLLNNNIDAFSGTIQGSLVRHRDDINFMRNILRQSGQTELPRWLR